MKRHTLRSLAVMVVAVLAVACGLALGACSSGPSAEDIIREDIATNLDDVKNMDDATLDGLARQIGSVGLEEYGIDTGTLITSMIDGFDYSIESVEVEDDTATASVTVTAKSMTEFTNFDYDIMADDIVDAVTSGEIDTTDQDAFNAWVGEYIMGMIDDLEPVEKDITFTYVNGEDGWELDESSVNDAAQIFL